MAHHVATVLMFEGAAEQAMNTYVALFKGAIEQVDRYRPGEPGPEGWIKRAAFTLAGHDIVCFDSSIKHGFTFTPATSLWIDCENEAELDEAYRVLSDGGAVLMPVGQYGFSARFAWVNDRFGVSWQLNVV
jgi:predicted 3-demethylubiquinone-9 3-methyltransferase (glyoxalase superfamily)